LEPEAREFLDVPNSARLRMHWYIFGPAWRVEECERELKLMADARVGGVLIFPTYPIALDDRAHGIHNQVYLSTEFLETLRAVTAICRKLGLTADIVLGTGWPFGGPSVTPADGAKMLSRIAIPVTNAGPVALPPLENSGKLIGVYYVEPMQSVALSVGRDGSVTPPATGGEIQVFYSAPTGMQVKRASVGAEGLVLDHYDEGALARYLDAVGNKLLDAVPAGGIRSVFCDSFEVYRANWTDRFAEIFERKRGYDLMPHLPALFDRANPDSRDVRCDFWRTLSEQAFEAFVQPLSEWAHRKGVTTQIESYGTPAVSLASYRAVDTPVGEHYEWKEFNTSRWASSGARLAGKNTVLAEAWTWLGAPNRFADTLEHLKRCSDLHFLSGINALYGLTYAYSPAELGTPGWVPYFGPAVNHTSPYWPHFQYLVDYVNRASYILQRGKPVADVALYIPSEDAMAEAETEQLMLNWAVRDRMSSTGAPPEFSLKNALTYESDVVKTIITNGYSLDGVDTFAFREMRVEDGRLRSGDGDYGILVMPNVTGIDLDSLRKIATFVEQGGVLIATRKLPETAYGMRDRDANRWEVERLVGDLFGKIRNGVASQPNRFDRGVAIFSRDERTSLLNALRWQQPDITFRAASEHVSFIHRQTAGRDYYFLANTSEQAQQLDATFRVGAKAPESWDLHTGEVEPILVFEHTKAGTRVPITLGPLESRVIAFSENGRRPVTPDSDLVLEPARDGWKTRVFENRAFYIQRARGRENLIVDGIPDPVRLSAPWRLQLEHASDITLEELKSWTEIPEARFFSGRGTYETEFQMAERPPDGLGVILDLGRVHETAEVHINGDPAGVAWMRPYRLDITSRVRRGTNRLRVSVTNLLINRVLGLGPIDYSAVYERYGRRFPPGEEWEKVREPLVSGLLGPVRLVFYKTIYGKTAVRPPRRSSNAVI
jgi:hypothetical protein